MAFNPFNFFRRNSKIIFSVLTIFIMFMFVLSFGNNDFFSAFPRWLASQQSHGDTVARIDGSKITDYDLSQLGTHRNVVNRYMSTLADFELRALGSSMNSRMQPLQTLYGPQEQTGQPTQNAIEQMTLPPEQQKMGYRLFKVYEQFLLGLQSGDIEGMTNALGEVSKLEGSALIGPAEKDTAEALRKYGEKLKNAIGRSLATQGNGNSRAEILYFANQPNESKRDQLEFKLWLKKADQLGIRYTIADIKSLVENEFPELKKEEILDLAAQMAKSDRENSVETMFQNIGDEFRVRAAQTAVMGSSDVRSLWLNPAVPLPEQQKHFLEATEVTKMGLLRVPVAPFESLVTGEPTEAELNKIYSEAKNLVPDPTSPRGGLTEPRRIKVQYLEITGKEKYYDAIVTAKAAIPPEVPQSLAQLVGGAAGPVLPYFTYADYKNDQAATLTNWKSAAKNPGDPGKSLAQAAILSVGPLASTGTQSLTSAAPLTAPQPLADASVAKLTNVGVLAGLFGGAFATGGSPLLAPVLVTESAYSTETEVRLLAGIRGFFVPTLGGAVDPLTKLAAEFAQATAAPQPLPQALVQPYLNARTADLQRNAIVVEDIERFQRQLATVMAQPDKALAKTQAADAITKFTTERELKTGLSAEPRDIHTIADDPGLQPLVLKNRPLLTVNKLDNDRVRHAFGHAFFFEATTGTPGSPASRASSSTGLYAPRLYAPESAQLSRTAEPEQFYTPAAKLDLQPTQLATGPMTLIWRTEDIDSVRPLRAKDEAVVAKCKLIWKREKAKQLARKAVEDAQAELASQVTSGGANAEVVAKAMLDIKNKVSSQIPNPLDQLYIKYVESNEYDNASLLYDMNVQAGPAPTQKFFQIQPNDNIVFPTEKMITDVAAARDKPIGTTIVASDKPEANYYLWVVANKVPHPKDDFRNYVLNRPPSNMQNAQMELQLERFLGKSIHKPFYVQNQRAAAREARQEAVELLKAEFRVTEETELLDKKDAR